MTLKIPRRKFLHYRNLLLSSVAVIYLVIKLWNRWTTNPVHDWYNLILLAFFFVNVAVVANSIRQLFRTSPALLITNEGMVDYISPARMALIPWSNVTDAEIRQYRGYPHLLVSITNNQQAIDSARLINRYLIKQTIKKTGAAIIVNCEMLDYDREQLLEEIMDKLGKPMLDRHLISE
jgi:hypothetical protein